ncbi:hypothetical protein F5Y15DRAFT_13097 [Xylariaceae sp. FL0016]|nr:hypothetical protein F5Y15DRAFT_13097 [Xylariaceae sp. FL0016]
MSPPLPVPSKAAIHALRGIALGTSCAIGVIVEDRRRKISTLQTAIANNEKIKTFRRYHGSLDVASLHFDDSIVIEGGELSWQERLDDHREHQTTAPIFQNKPKLADREWTRHYEDSANYTEARDTTDRPLGTAIPSPRKSTYNKQSLTQNKDTLSQSPSAIRPSGRSPEFHPTGTWPSLTPKPYKVRLTLSREPTREIAGILDSPGEDRLDRAVLKFLNSVSKDAWESSPKEWHQISLLLSKECQEREKWEEATAVLLAIVNIGPLDEAQYHAYNPLPTIEANLHQPDPKVPCSQGDLTLAAKLFLARYEEKPRLYGKEVESLGRRFILLALERREFLLAHSIYWRVTSLLGDVADFVGWAIRQLHECGDHKNVIKFFLVTFSRSSPNAENFHMTIDCVVKSIQALKGQKASSVISAFSRMDCPANARLRTRWILQLMQAHWQRYEDFSKSADIFEKVKSLNLLEKVGHPEAVYRTMTEIAVRANNSVLAQAYYEEAIRIKPGMSSDVALRGFLALLKAKGGNWDGVQEDFKSMRPQRQLQRKQYDDAFVMILKIYAETHPCTETRHFVEHYSDSFDVHLHRYTVTLVANKYGDCHDLAGFMAWLAYCTKNGFGLEAGWCNSVLYNCHSKWKFSFAELHRLYSRLEQLNPDAFDEVTMRIMSQAAIKQGRRFIGSTGLRIHHKVISVSQSAYQGRSTDKREIYEAMNQELKNSKPSAAISIYRRAMRYGMPFCSHCLRLAVAATLRPTSGGKGAAMSLINNAHQAGHDVGPAVSVFIRNQIDQFQGTPKDVIIYMRNLINRFEAVRIAIDPSVLTHFAITLIKIGQYDKAIAMCSLAKERSGSMNLCFSQRNATVLLTAYSRTLDNAGMRMLIDDLLTSSLDTDRNILRHLKSVKRTVQKLKVDQAVETMLDLVSKAIEEVVQRRAATRADGMTISEETLRIMGDAVANMERNTLPWEEEEEEFDSPHNNAVQADSPQRLAAVA